MTYIVLETQTNNGTTAIVPPAAYTTRNDAEAKFHAVLQIAATSAVEEHAAVLLTSDGHVLRNECYRHEAEPAQEPAEVEGE